MPGKLVIKDAARLVACLDKHKHFADWLKIMADRAGEDGSIEMDHLFMGGPFDWGWTWYDSEGKRLMNGGLIYHDGEDRWTSHT